MFPYIDISLFIKIEMKTYRYVNPSQRRGRVTCKEDRAVRKKSHLSAVSIAVASFETMLLSW